ncbi:hypothetical protein NQZ68_010177 [Dissostichus eleginoides]|nr:hypothetical protein NQZ68_010177 [Dissostichus eleginoides]
MPKLRMCKETEKERSFLAGHELTPDTLRARSMRTGYEKHTLSNAAIWVQSDERQQSEGFQLRALADCKDKMKSTDLQ